MWQICSGENTSGSTGTPGTAIFQVFMVQHFDKGRPTGVNFIQIEDNYGASLSLELNILIKMYDKMLRVLICNHYLIRVLTWIFMKTDFQLLKCREQDLV